MMIMHLAHVEPIIDTGGAVTGQRNNNLFIAIEFRWIDVLGLVFAVCSDTINFWLCQWF